MLARLLVLSCSPRIFQENRDCSWYGPASKDTNSVNNLAVWLVEVEKQEDGDPLSPYLFIIAAEILATAIQTNKDIHGLQIGKGEFMLIQYADDLTVFVSNIECAKRVFHLLDEFRSCSGLKVNYTKTEAVSFGCSRDSTAAPLGLGVRA